MGPNRTYPLPRLVPVLRGEGAVAGDFPDGRRQAGLRRRMLERQARIPHHFQVPRCITDDHAIAETHLIEQHGARGVDAGGEQEGARVKTQLLVGFAEQVADGLAAGCYEAIVSLDDGTRKPVFVTLR